MLLDSLDYFIADEEMIALFTSSNSVAQHEQPQKGKPQKEQTLRGSLPYMYCGEDHKAGVCTRYGTPQEWDNYLHPWTYNTPSPWQGGVYERLIRSVKLAMNKTLGKVTPSREELGTLIVEIESVLNTPPLLYNEFEVLPPMQMGDDLIEDQGYLSPAERLASQTKYHE
ncbi:unnamed protein product [Heligmosomoides polygyrus]|uniref:Uncharacterized protein n=1 Tax=Heligmosomoides polygyrus TaxID=6339 RepID=A0A183G1C0_HELPZ|nr:unnamed protein product [Heligmosomoides polygyrus]